MLPMIIFGLMSIIGGIVCLLLPETLKQPLPETLEDARDNLIVTPAQVLYNCHLRKRPTHAAQFDSNDKELVDMSTK